MATERRHCQNPVFQQWRAFFVLLKQYVLAYDTNVGNAIFNVLRNIIIAQKENFQGEIICFCLQPVFHIA